MGRFSNCLKRLDLVIGIYYKGTVYSEYLSQPQVHLTSWGDVLQSAQSRQAVLWVAGICYELAKIASLIYLSK